MYKIKNILSCMILFALCLIPSMSVHAGTLNPSTGDTSGRYIWVVAAVAAVALIAVIITAVMGKKGGKK